MRRAAVAFSLFAMVGCAGPYVMCSMPSASDQVQIQAVIEESRGRLPMIELLDKNDNTAMVDIVEAAIDPHLVSPGDFAEAAPQVYSWLTASYGFYIPYQDRILIDKTLSDPDRQRWVAIHELAHATGSTGRLAREPYVTLGQGNFGDKLRSMVREEVMAELASYIVFAEAGRPKPDGTAYMRYHLYFADPGDISALTQDARAAAGYILGREPVADCQIRKNRWPWLSWPGIKQLAWCFGITS